MAIPLYRAWVRASPPLSRTTWCVLVCSASIGCSGATATTGEQTPSGVDGGVDADAMDAPPIDAGRCVPAGACSIANAACKNDCGQPCQCIDPFGDGILRWVCLRPLTGTRCDLSALSTCYYPAVDPKSDHDAGNLCTCQSPAGESFWDCGDDSLCPPDGEGVVTGESCKPLPLGLWCRYAPTFACQCVSGGDGVNTNRVWQCAP